jgi:hypothetical protein
MGDHIMGLFSSVGKFFGAVGGLLGGADASDEVQQVTKDKQDGIKAGINQYKTYLDSQSADTYNHSYGLLDPYRSGGKSAYDQLLNRLGVNNNHPYQASNVQFDKAYNSPAYKPNSNYEKIYSDYLNLDMNSALAKTMQRQQEETLLRNSAATGGLRGGNTQAALAELAPNLAQKLLESRIGIDQIGYDRGLQENTTNYNRGFQENNTNYDRSLAGNKLNYDRDQSYLDQLFKLSEGGANSSKTLIDLLSAIDQRRLLSRQGIADLEKASGQVQGEGTAAQSAVRQGQFDDSISQSMKALNFFGK